MLLLFSVWTHNLIIVLNLVTNTWNPGSVLWEGRTQAINGAQKRMTSWLRSREQWRQFTAVILSWILKATQEWTCWAGWRPARLLKEVGRASRKPWWGHGGFEDENLGCYWVRTIDGAEEVTRHSVMKLGFYPDGADTSEVGLGTTCLGG